MVRAKITATGLAACLLVGLTGCATTRQVREDQRCGFVGDYSLLRQGVGTEANYVYIDRGASWDFDGWSFGADVAFRF